MRFIRDGGLWLVGFLLLALVAASLDAIIDRLYHA